MMKKMVLCCLGIYSTLSAMDNAHFYRATNLFQETRLGIDLLTSIDVSAGWGQTHKSRNTQEYKVPLFDLYGPNNMHDLGVNVPGKSNTNALDLILCQLANTPERTVATTGCNCSIAHPFAAFSINGEFNIIESNISVIQNAILGFFGQLYLPVRRITVDDICFKDISPADEESPNNTTPIWVAFKNNFEAILARYHLSAAPVRETGVGDLSILIGWTNNYQETEFLDFVDTTIKFGVLAPTGKKRNEDQIFSIPLGYNGHIGVPLSADVAIGLYDWLTIAGHIDGIFFASTKRNIRLKTSPSQNGIIKLAKGEATISKGAVWTFGLSLKADHIYRGFSLLAGYSYAAQRSDTVAPCDTFLFSPSSANCDSTLQGWNMQTIHLMGEYDFTKDDSRVGGRVAGFYNVIVNGKRIFNTNMVVGNVGIDINWKF
jgi:hypothetical protein